MQRVYERARKTHDEMMEQELRPFEALEEKAAGIKKPRAKPQPTHRSKKDRKLTWSGRGSMPRWMREEMKELKVKPGRSPYWQAIMQALPPSFPYGIFVEAPDDLESLQAMAAKFDARAG
jgi:H-NS histone family